MSTNFQGALSTTTASTVLPIKCEYSSLAHLGIPTISIAIVSPKGTPLKATPRCSVSTTSGNPSGVWLCQLAACLFPKYPSPLPPYQKHGKMIRRAVRILIMLRSRKSEEPTPGQF